MSAVTQKFPTTERPEAAAVGPMQRKVGCPVRRVEMRESRLVQATAVTVEIGLVTVAKA